MCGFYKRVPEWKVLWKKTCRKTTAETRRHHQKGLVAATNCGRMEEVLRGLEHFEGKLLSSAKKEEEDEEREDREEDKEVDEGRRTRRRKRRGGGEGCG